MLLAAAACTGRRPARLPSITATTGQIEVTVRAALERDAAADHTADTLYAAEAIVIANARLRHAAPRFAGVGPGGRITVAAVTVTALTGVAWAMVDYRWINLETRQAEAGRATFVLEQRPGAWRIVHAHSSQLLPWDR